LRETSCALGVEIGKRINANYKDWRGRKDITVKRYEGSTIQAIEEALDNLADVGDIQAQVEGMNSR
jgi:hypothetical protein